MSPLRLRTVRLPMSSRPQAELRIGLHIDLEGPAELVELVDIGRTEIGGERGKHLVERDVEGLRS